MSTTHKLGMDTRKLAYDRLETPAVHIQPDDIVILETEDANCSHILKDSDVWDFKSIYEAAGGCNPLDGPIYVEGAKAGDYLAVDILEVIPGFLRNGGYTSVQSGCGVLEDIQGTIQAPLEPSSRVCSFIDGKIHMNLEGGKQHVEIDMSPFVGSIGVAPKEDRRSSFFAGEDWCGNVDIPAVRAGVTVVLPVNVDGAYLMMGDVHGCQGDAELTGCALECQGIIKARVRLIPKGQCVYGRCPQVNSEEWIGSIGVAGRGNMTSSMTHAYADLVQRMIREYGIERNDAYMILGLAGKAQIGNENTCLCTIEKKYLVKHNNK